MTTANDTYDTRHVPDWLLWQLIDSAFPTGGFAHSCGLEAAVQQGEVNSHAELADFFRTSLTQTGRAQQPLVLAARAAPDRMPELDVTCDAMLRNHVANRASRAQGQAFLVAGEKAFDAAGIGRLRMVVRRDRLPGHFAPAFGASAGLLEFPPFTTAMAFLFVTLRGLVSAAVRLGIVGPLQAQAMQYDVAPYAQGVAERFMDAPEHSAAQTAPLIDILQGAQDRLYSRLFQT